MIINGYMRDVLYCSTSTCIIQVLDRYLDTQVLYAHLGRWYIHLGTYVLASGTYCTKYLRYLL